MRDQFDPFTVESLLLGYRMPAATKADKAAATQELVRQGYGSEVIAQRLEVSLRNVHRLRRAKVEPMGELPAWCDDYEREWPKCEAGHELTPDNYRERWDGRTWRRECRICTAARKRYYDQRRDKEKHRAAKRKWAQRRRAMTA